MEILCERRLEMNLMMYSLAAKVRITVIEMFDSRNDDPS